jgi:oligopeptide/dipeptide ABC transporter ATP-binding protein
MTALLTIGHLTVAYGGRQALRAVVDVSLAVGRGQSMALIGESGSGKSSIARAVCGLAPVESGTIAMEGVGIADTGDRAASAGRAGIQIVFQDPVSGLDPRWPAWRSVAEPRFAQHPAPMQEHRHAAGALLERVGLHGELADRRPHQLSGGQRQRVTIARALSAEPKLVILDEAVSALDVSVRNEILALLHSLKEERGLTYLLISHDMGAVAQMSTHVAVLYLGRLMEVGSTEQVIRRPVHPYTRALIAAVPTIGAKAAGEQARAIGEIDDPAHPPPGCRYHRRCAFAAQRCREEEPSTRTVDDRQVACHRAEEIMADPAAATTRQTAPHGLEVGT